MIDLSSLLYSLRSLQKAQAHPPILLLKILTSQKTPYLRRSTTRAQKERKEERKEGSKQISLPRKQIPDEVYLRQPLRLSNLVPH